MIVRSRHAHGIIKKIDTDAARKMKGVLGVYTGADLAAAGYGTLKCIVPFKNRDGSEMKKPPRHALATDRVRFVGDPVAFVVADTLNRAKDAAEAVEVDIETLPAVTDPEQAVQRRMRRSSMTTCPATSSLDYHFGDAEAVQAAFAKARACHAPQDREQPRGGERDGAARGGRRLRRTDASRCTAARRAWSA